MRVPGPYVYAILRLRGIGWSSEHSSILWFQLFCYLHACNQHFSSGRVCGGVCFLQKQLRTYVGPVSISFIGNFEFGDSTRWQIYSPCSYFSELPTEIDGIEIELIFYPVGLWLPSVIPKPLALCFTGCVPSPGSRLFPQSFPKMAAFLSYL